jgi:hypothetical protein
VRVVNEIVLDDVGRQNLFDSIHRIWIAPELKRREELGILRSDLKISSCLIRLPRNQSPIVEFNNEISWTVETIPVSEAGFTEGQLVRLADVKSIKGVCRPSVNEEPVAYWFLFWNGDGWILIFDSNPPSSDEGAENSNVDWTGSQVVADYLNIRLRELAVQNCRLSKGTLAEIGLWTIPSLLPYPLSAICDLCADSRYEEARNLLIEHCDFNVLSSLVSNWGAITAFSEREQLFHSALSAYHAGNYAVALHVLVPHIEGVITDWLHSNPCAVAVPWKQDTKTKKFKEVILSSSSCQMNFINYQSLESTIDFILNGPFLSTFHDWNRPESGYFPNRHLIGHGKFDQESYSQENALKAFLMLDTIHNLMQAYGGVNGDESAGIQQNP